MPYIDSSQPHQLFYFTVFYNFLSLLIVHIVDDDWGPRGGQRGFSVVSHTQIIHFCCYAIVLNNLPVRCEIITSQILGIFPKFVMSQAKGEKWGRDGSFCLSIALTLVL